MVAAIVVAAIALFVAALAGSFARAWAQSVENRDAPLEDRVHAVRRRSALWTIGALVVGLVLGSLALGVAGSHGDGVRVGAGTRTVGVVAAIVCYLVPVLAVARGIRLPYARMREIPTRNAGSGRQVLLGLLVYGVFAGTVAAGAALAPRHGGGHVVGIALGYLIALALLQILSPLTIRVTGVRPLPPELESRLRALAAEMGVRVHRFGIIPSRRQRLANAAQVGVLPGFQDVLLTEYLVEQMTPEEIDAVAAHELGHVRGHHLQLMFALLIPLWAIVEGLVIAGRGEGGGAGYLLAAVGLPIGLFTARGLIGLRLEQRADNAAAAAVGPAHLASALSRLGTLNHTPQHTGRLWNVMHAHPGLGDRIALLQADQPARSSGGGHRAGARVSGP